MPTDKENAIHEICGNCEGDGACPGCTGEGDPGCPECEGSALCPDCDGLGTTED